MSKPTKRLKLKKEIIRNLDTEEAFQLLASPELRALQGGTGGVCKVSKWLTDEVVSHIITDLVCEPISKFIKGITQGQSCWGSCDNCWSTQISTSVSGMSAK